jgi:DNA-binding PucR family transcriptional regulator
MSQEAPMSQLLDLEALREELERKDRELRLVADVSAMIGRSAPLRAILDRVAALAAEMLATPYAAILLITLDGRQMTIEGAYGLTEPYIKVINHHGLHPDGLVTLPSLEVCRSGRPQIWHDMVADPRLVSFHAAQRLQGVRSMISLNCYHHQANHFGPDDIQLLARTGVHAAQAIYNARLVERLSATIRRLSEMHGVVQHQNATLTRSDAIHRRLTALVLEAQGLEAIVQTLATILGCGVQLYDAQLLSLTAAPPPHGDGPPVVSLDAQLLSATATLGAPPQSIVRLRRGPLVSAPALLCPIGARGKTLGFLVVPATPAMDGELERRAIEHGATICAVELLKQRVGQEVAWRQRAAFLDDLLAGRLSDHDEIRQRTRHLGYSLEGHSRLLLARVDGLAASVDRRRLGEQQAGDLKQQLAETMARVAQQLHPQAIVVPRGEHLAVLLPVTGDGSEAGARLAAALIEAVARDFPDLSASVGLSGLAAGPEAFARAYREAEEALAVIGCLGAGGALLCHDEIGFYSLILRGGARDDLLRLSRRWLDGLAGYKRRRGVDLIATLDCYLRNGCNPQRAAAALFVHPNTVKHRLRLIAEQTGADLGDTRQLLELQLALLVRRLLSEGDTPGDTPAA